MLYPFLRGDRRKALRVALASARWIVAAVLAGSALQLAAAPRADQPLIDLAEYAVPQLRSLYFTAAEQAAFADAGAYAERYRREAEELNERERRNRTEGEAFDDFSVARISSFLKSYGEMRKGEQFVMDEVRARARERVRWSASLALLLLALLVAPASLAARGRGAGLIPPNFSDSDQSWTTSSTGEPSAALSAECGNVRRRSASCRAGAAASIPRRS